MKSPLQIIAALLLLTTLFSACKKAEKGEPGKNGSANISTRIITVNPSDWGTVVVIDTTYQYVSADLPELTQGVFDSGVFLVYMDMGHDIWTQLPVVLTDLAGNTDKFSCYHYPGKFSIGYRSSKQPAYFTTLPIKLKVVVIPSL